MKVIVRGVHLSLTDALKNHVEEHLVKPLTRFYENEAAELDIQLLDNNGPKGGLDKECRVTAHFPGLSTQHVSEATEDLYKSIDLVRDRLKRIIKRELEKQRSVSSSRG